MDFPHGRRGGIPLNDRLNEFLSNSWVELVCRWVIGILFVFASVHKWMYPAQFAKIIYGYQLVPNEIINLLAITLPFLELYGGGALLLGIYPKSAALVINFMVSMFILAVWTNLIRGHSFDCGCFSIGTSDSTSALYLSLIRDLILFVMGGYVMGFKGRPKGCIRPER
jgi:putative oxidoreductase